MLLLLPWQTAPSAFVFRWSARSGKAAANYGGGSGGSWEKRKKKTKKAKLCLFGAEMLHYLAAAKKAKSGFLSGSSATSQLAWPRPRSGESVSEA